MKISALILFSFLTSVSFAGPEDHLYDSCYTATAPVYNMLPSTFCFEDAKLDVNSNILSISGYASNVPDSLKVNSVYRKNDSQYSFVASHNLINIWNTGCGDGYIADLIISGDANVNGKVNAKELKFTVNYKSKSDTCHSPLETGAIEYKLSK